jgi:hypothetical protein
VALTDAFVRWLDREREAAPPLNRSPNTIASVSSYARVAANDALGNIHVATRSISCKLDSWSIIEPGRGPRCGMREDDQQNAWREIAKGDSTSAGVVLWCLIWTVVFILGAGVFITIFGPH